VVIALSLIAMVLAVSASSRSDKSIDSSNDSAYDTILASTSTNGFCKLMNNSKEIASELMLIVLFGPSNLIISFVASIYIYSLPTLD